jgi:hypothetical protein
LGIISKAASAWTLPPEYPGILFQGWLLEEMWILAEVSIVAIYRVQHPSLHYIVAVDCAHGVTILSHRGQ